MKTIHRIVVLLSASFLSCVSHDLAAHPGSKISLFGGTPLPPSIELISKNGPADGDLFLANFSFLGSADAFLLIVDNDGKIIQEKSIPNSSALDFKIQTDGEITYFDTKFGAYCVVDSFLNTLRQISATNGFTTDNHELIIAENGHYFFIAKYGYTLDMSTLVTGGKKNADILADAIMEYDESGNEIMEWRTQDHFQITDATHEDLTAQSIDYCHANSLDIAQDGNLILSTRNMDEVTKIDPVTGNIIWRWGGKHNEFTFIGDTLGFSHQHCVHLLPNGHYLFLDNGNYHTPSFSRAVEYALDEDKKTATLVWQYRHNPDKYAFAMGSVQRLSNGNTLIGWGADTTCTLTEVTPDGKVALEMKMKGVSYRVFKFPWQPPTPLSDVKQGDGSSFALSNYPNPAAISTTFSYGLSTDAFTSLTIADCLGRVVSNLSFGAQAQGDHTYTLDLSRFTRGVYLCTLEAGGVSTTTRLVVN
jgi:hypothetical protein